MNTNLYDHAYELEKAMRSSDEFKHLQEMYKSVTNDSEASQMFDEFRNVQMQLQQKQMQGYDITEDEVMRAQEIANRAQENEKVTMLMEAEQRMSMTITELNKIIMKPLDDLYGSMA
ncbi:protein YheA [Bacillus freudenreichii]|nr:protein YheA [Bacillus freudenreichii]